MGAAVSAASGESKAPPPSWFVINPSPVTPDWENGKTSADPNYGFEQDGKKRKEREPPCTLAELASAKVEPKYRDFCSHKMIAYKKCIKDNFPFHPRCHHLKHDLEHCQVEDYLVRMKEYERERRLLHRKQRKEARQAKENH